MPAAAQGVVGIECLERQRDLIAILQQIEDPTSVVTTAAERAVAARLNASCQSPVASFAELDGDTLTVRALVASEDGQTIIRASISGDISNAAALGEAAAEQLLAEGAGDLLQALGE